jgi:hypothetical protein
MKNQTAITWLIKELNKNVNFVPMVHWDAIREIVQKAKELEKQQIIDAVNVGFDEGAKFPEDIKLNNAEQYYNQTYNL